MGDITLDTVTLPHESMWVDKYQWTGVQGNVRYTIGGRMVVEMGTSVGNQGRPVTLGGGDAWIEKDDLDTLYTWAEDASKQMTLTLQDGTSYTVRFRHWDSPVIEAENLKNIANPSGSDYFILTSLKLVVVT